MQNKRGGIVSFSEVSARVIQSKENILVSKITPPPKNAA